MSTDECLDENVVAEFLDGLLSEGEAARVERHTATCAACRQLMAVVGGSSEPMLPMPPVLPSTLPEGMGQTQELSLGNLSLGLAATVPAPGSGAPVIALEQGQTVGRFRVLGRIGSGGMGVVFSAYDPKLDRKVALKLLRSPDDTRIPLRDAQMRLLREAQAMAQLSHPNVIQVYDVGTYASEVYIAMEFVEGRTLTRWLRKEQRPWQEIVDKFLQAGRALAAAHARGLMHRDFKPDNVLVGNDKRVRVMDFGLARSLFAEASRDAIPLSLAKTLEPVSLPLDDAGNILHHPLTRTGMLVGTPRYMAPEQFAAREVDARSDQFSFCVALYEALYGYHPFADNTAFGLARSPKSTPVRPPPEDTRVPSWVHAVVLRGLSAQASERFPGMQELLQALEPATRPERPARVVAAALVAVVALAAAVYFYLRREAAIDEAELLRTQLVAVNTHAEELTQELRKIQTQLEDAPPQNQQIEDLQTELTRTKSELTQVLAELEQTQRKLDALERVAAESRAKPREPASGLSQGQVLTELDRHYADLEDCFAEWRDRTGTEPPTFAVRLRIAETGAPEPIRSGGLEDQVVYTCVTGALEDIRFPATETSTVVNLGFRYGEDGLGYSATIMPVETPSAGSQDG